MTRFHPTIFSVHLQGIAGVTFACNVLLFGRCSILIMIRFAFVWQNVSPLHHVDECTACISLLNELNPLDTGRTTDSSSDQFVVVRRSTCDSERRHRLKEKTIDSSYCLRGRERCVAVDDQRDNTNECLDKGRPISEVGTIEMMQIDGRFRRAKLIGDGFLPMFVSRAFGVR